MKKRFRTAAIVAIAIAASIGGGALVLPLGEAAAGFFGGHRRPDPEAVREHAAFAVDWALGRVDATDEQKARVTEIVDRTLMELAPLHEGRSADREAFFAALTGSAVDRDALEQLRTEKLDEMAVASEQIVDALVQVAQILTPEQRTELASLAERWHR